MELILAVGDGLDIMQRVLGQSGRLSNCHKPTEPAPRRPARHLMAAWCVCRPYDDQPCEFSFSLNSYFLFICSRGVRAFAFASPTSET
jgi:hypothetical protein